MKLQPDRFDTQSIAGHGANWIGVITRQAGVSEAKKFSESLIIGSQGELQIRRPQHFSELEATDFAPIIAFNPEVVIIGSGKQQRFCPPALLTPFYEKRIGVETMDTLAACRTYNILAQEGRHVIAALITEFL